MKAKLFHIASSLFLVCVILLAQVGATFFHNNHDVHQAKGITKPLENGKAGLQKHDEHCKLCAIDFFHQALISSSLSIADVPVITKPTIALTVGFEKLNPAYFQGRAPPTHFIQ